MMYMGSDHVIPLFTVTLEHLKAELPIRHHGQAQKYFEEMYRYMSWSGLAAPEWHGNFFTLTSEAIDLGESHWYEKHPVWFGALLGGVISFASALILALLKQYWLTKS